MAQLCECCGQRNNNFAGDPLYITGEKIICCECAKPVIEDINAIYYINSDDEYNSLKAKILDKCHECYNDTITEYICIIMEYRYSRSDFVIKSKKEMPETNAAGNTLSIDYQSNNHASNNSSVSANESGMFSNIGGKIKTLAKVITWIGIALSVIMGFAMMVIDDDMALSGIMTMILGPLFFWISSFVLYGFGQLIENSDKLVRASEKNN